MPEPTDFLHTEDREWLTTHGWEPPADPQQTIGPCDQSPELHVFRVGGELTRPETDAWLHWFRQHGVKLSNPDGSGRMLVWSGPDNQCGYVRRDITRRRISWINAQTHKEEFFQLEAPPRPFPREVT